MRRDAVCFPALEQLGRKGRVVQQPELVLATTVAEVKIVGRQIETDGHGRKKSCLEVVTDAVKIDKKLAKPRQDVAGRPDIRHDAVILSAQLKRLFLIWNRPQIFQSILVKDILRYLFATDTGVATVVPALWWMGSLVLFTLG